MSNKKTDRASLRAVKYLFDSLRIFPDPVGIFNSMRATSFDLGSFFFKTLVFKIFRDGNRFPKPYNYAGEGFGINDTIPTVEFSFFLIGQGNRCDRDFQIPCNGQ